MKVLIAGGGIGGLTAALCCLHHGHEVIVFEQADALGDVGAGIQMPPNAMRVFRALGLEGAMDAAAFRPRALEARMGQSGRRIFKVPITEHSLQEWGAPYLHIHRADLIDILAEVLPQDVLRHGASVSGYEQNDEGITVSLANGQIHDGDILIGADGIHSAVRAQMLSKDDPIFTGNIAWRAVVRADALGDDLPDPTACVWMGAGRHAVTYRLRQGELVNFVGVVEQEGWQEESWTAKGRKEDALNDFKNWHPVITKILEAAPPDAFYRWALFDRPPLAAWTDGRAALLGDSAHPMLPFMAQGAAMAIEDAWVLAQEISRKNRNIKVSLNVYQAARLPRTRRVQAQSRSNMKTFHKRSSAGQIAAYGPMWAAGKLAPSLIRNRLNWLYAHDVVNP